MRNARSTACSRACRARPSGFTLMELMVVLVIMGVLAAFAIPSYRRAIEQSRADIAGANLRAIWAAERSYWLETQEYTEDLSLLTRLGLLDPRLPIEEPTVPIQEGQYWGLYYWYSVTLGTDPKKSFTAYVKAAQYTGCTSTLTIDESGKLDGHITPPGPARIITPIDFW
jgi:prepilin-type N-terminal cleavage/methylation domain-containing protein